MKTGSRNGRRRHGAAAVELAACLPLLTALLLGGWQLGCLFEAHQALAQAAGQGGRMASTGLASNSAVRTLVLSTLTNAGVPTGSVVVTIQDLDLPGASDLSSARRGDRIQVSVSIPANAVSWFRPKNSSGGTPTWTINSIWCCVKESG